MRLYLPIILLSVMLLLSSCADTEWPQWLSGEPTKEQLDAYKGSISMPDPDTQGKAWPNLADVPARPKIILRNNKKDALVTEMKKENAEGLKEIEDYNKGIPLVVKDIVLKPVQKKYTHNVVKKKKTHKKKGTPHVQ